MPLQHSSSPSAFKANVSTLMKERGISPHVKDKSQALAIAYSVKNRAKRKHGGKVKGYDAGGATDAVNQVITALQSGSNQNGGAGSNPGMSAPAPQPSGGPIGMPTVGLTAPQNNVPNPQGNTGLGSSNPLANQMGTVNSPVAQMGTVNSPIGSPTVGTPSQMQTVNTPTGGIAPMGTVNGATPNAVGFERGGVAHLAAGGIGQMPWYVKNEAHGLMHTGPVMSAIPGRTDRHNVSVPSSSYVFPADFVSHLGQNNSGAGMKVLSNMGFGSGSPVPAAPKLGRGMGLPKPPRLMGIPGDAGGRKGEGKIGMPTPVVIAGGEFVADPHAIMKVLKTNDIRHAHHVLDNWVLKVRKDHIKTLRGLPPPAKS